MKSNKKIIYILIAIATISGLIIWARTPRAPSIKKADSDSGFLYAAGNKNYHLKLGKVDSNKPTVEFGIEENTITFTLLDANMDTVDVKKKGKSVTFADVRNSIDLVYKTLPNGVKEEIVLKEAGTPSTYLFEMDLSNTEVKSVSTNFPAPVFYNAEGEYLFHFEKPYAIDSNENRTEDVSLQIKKISDKEIYQIRITVSEDWLRSSERVYPIYIDPTIVHKLSSEFDHGEMDRVSDAASPQLETYYQELPADEHTQLLLHFNENANGTCSGGTDVCDSSGNGYNSNWAATAAYTTDARLGQSAGTFDGNSDYIDAQPPPVKGYPFTLEAWVKSSTSADQLAVAVYDASAANIYYAMGTNSAGNAVLTARNTTTYSTTGKLVSDGNWHHLAAVFVSNTERLLYLDGNLQGIGTDSVTFNTAVVDEWSVGAISYSTTAAYFNGEIDEVRISSVARTSEEIKASANRSPYSTYTSPVIDLGAAVTSWKNLTWTESGVLTDDGETVSDSTNLIAQWNFNETSGTTANNDAEGTSCGGTPANCDGTLTSFANTSGQDIGGTNPSGWTANNLRWGAGALEFEGTSTSVNVGNDSSLQITGNITVSSWIKTSVPANAAIFSKYDDDGVNERAILLATNTASQARFILDSTGDWTTKADISSNIVVTDGNWHHIVGTYDGSFIKLFVDGKEAASASYSSGIYNSPTSVEIGSMSDQTEWWFDGMIDSTQVYSRALSADEIVSLYNASNMEFETRVGSTHNPNDGNWEAWKPTTSESQIESLDSDSSNWLVHNLSAGQTAPSTSLNISDESTIIQEGSGSLKVETAYKNPADANTVALWHLDETNGDNAGDDIFDETSNNHDGEFVGTNIATAVTEGVSGKTRTFDGINDYIDITNSTDFDIQNLTIEAWVFSDDFNQNMHIFEKGPANTQYSCFFNASNNFLYFRTYNTTPTINDLTIDASAYLTDNAWNHVACVYDGAKKYIYVNGAEANSAIYTETLQTAQSGQRIGANGTGGYKFDGKIDELRISDVGRTPEEIAESYRMGRDHYINKTISSTDLSGNTKVPFYVAADRPGTYLETTVGESAFANNLADSNTGGLWHFDEATDDACDAGLSDSCDSSGNGNHGDQTSDPPIVQGIIGKARSFDGSADYITVGDNNALDIATKNTFSGWFNVTDTATARAIISKGSEYLVRFNTDDTFSFFLYDGADYEPRLTAPVNPTAGVWHHFAAVYDSTLGSNHQKLYLDGALVIEQDRSITTTPTTNNVRIGEFGGSTYMSGSLDEIRLDSTARTADEIRQAYENGLRTHPITIDFAASLDSDNLIAHTGDLDFTIDSTDYGAYQKGDNLYKGDKVIIREVVDATEYIAQGTVTSITTSTGQGRVASWDSGSTTPPDGYTSNASVFKWQKEFWDITGPLNSHVNASTNLTLRVTDGNEGRTVWLDDFESGGAYLTTSTGSTITSSIGKQYFQYRAITSSSNEAVSANLTQVTMDYKTAEPSLHLKFDEGIDNTCFEGTNDACDSTGNNNDAAMTGGTWQEEGMCVSGKCMYFDGSDDVATVTNAATIDMDGGLAAGLTYQGWVKVTTEGEGSVGEIFQKGTNTYLRTTNEGTDGLADLEAKLDLGTSAATKTITNGITLDEWHHIAMTYTDDGDDEVTIYIDGLNKGSSSDGDGSPSSDANNLLVGGSSSANFHGFIDDFKIYNAERTAAQIKTDHTLGTSVKGISAAYGLKDYSVLSQGLVGYWPLDENTGTSTTSDKSGGRNDGTLLDIDSGDWVGGKFGSALNFGGEGTNEFIDIGDTAPFEFADGSDFTLSLWLNGPITATDTLLAKKAATTAGNSGYMLNINSDNTVTFYAADGTDQYQLDTTNTVTASTWTHILVVYDDDSTSNTDIYLDGVKQGATATGTLANVDNVGVNSRIVTIAAESDSVVSNAQNELEGKLDEVRIYKRALSPKEVQMLYSWAPGPVGYWPMDENTGTATTYDKSGNGNDGTLESIVESDWISGKYGSALNFDGTANDVMVSDNDTLIPSYAGTWSGWINLEKLPSDIGENSQILDHTGSSGNRGYYMVVNSGSDVFKGWMYEDGVNDTALPASDDALVVDRWYHFAYVWDGTIVSLYMDGNIQSTTSPVSTIYNTNKDLYFGSNGGSANFLNGSLDEIKIYDYARSPTQVIEDMNGGHPVGGSPVASPKHHYKLDEMSGTTTYDYGATAADGTFDSNAPTWTPSGKINGALDCEYDNGEHVDLGDTVSTETQLTVTAWIKPEGTTGGNRAIIGEGAYRLLVSNANKLALYIVGNPSDTSIGLVESTASISDGNWYHVAGVWNGDAGTWNLYVNGIEQADNGTANTVTSLDGSDSNAATICDMQNGTGNYFDGIVDEVKVYSTALTIDEIRTDMNAGSSSAMGGVLGSAEAADLTDGAGNSPIGYWPLDENTGTTTTYDKSGNNYDGTLTGTMTENDWVSGKFGSALEFDGSDDEVVLADGANFSSDTFTITAWINRNTDTGGNEYIFDNRDADNDGIRFLVASAGNDDISCSYNSFDADDTAMLVGINQWHFVACISDGSTISTYIDGSFVASTGSLTGSIAEATNATIGGCSYCSSGDFPGSIDDVRFYNYARTQAQISYEYNRGVPVGWWKLDECQGSTAYDLSGNNNNGNISIGSSSPNTSLGTCSSGTGTEAWNNGTTGKLNYSLDFDGTDDYIACTSGGGCGTNGSIDYSVLFDHDQDFTLSAWINADDISTTARAVIAQEFGTSLAFGVNTNGNLRMRFDDGTMDSSIGGVTTGSWYHIAAAYDGDTPGVTFYINGVSAGTDTNTDTVIATTSDFYIGWQSRSDTQNLMTYFDGRIDDVRIYNYTLSANQIKKAMLDGNAQRFGPATGAP